MEHLTDGHARYGSSHVAHSLNVPSTFALCVPAMAHGNLSALKYENTLNLPFFCLSNKVLSSPEAKCQPKAAPEVGNLNSCCICVYEAHTHIYLP